MVFVTKKIKCVRSDFRKCYFNCLILKPKAGNYSYMFLNEDSC